LYDLLYKETFAVKHVVDAEDQLQVKGDPEVQNELLRLLGEKEWAWNVAMTLK
jgi:hypothetical protein